MLSAESREKERQLRRAERTLTVARGAIGALFVWGAFASQRAMADVEHVNRVISAIDGIRMATLDVRMHYRGFVATADTAERDAMHVAEARRDSSMLLLRRLSANEPARRQRLDQLDADFDIMRAYVAVPIGVDSSSIMNARAEMSEPSRAAVRDGIDSLLRVMRQEEDSALNARTAQQHDSGRLLLVVAAGMLLLVAAAGIVTLQVRRRSAKAVAIREATFRHLADENPDGVLVLVDRDIVYANATAAQMLHAPVHELVGMPVLTIVHPDDRDAVAERTAQVRKGHSSLAPRLIRYLRTDGTVCEAEARGAPISFGGKDAVQVVLRDMSSRREVEAALQVSEQRFRAVLDAMEEGVVLQDRNMVVQLSNPAAARILGVSSEQLAEDPAARANWRVTDAEGLPLPPEARVSAVALRTGHRTTGIMSVAAPGQPQRWLSTTAVPIFNDTVTIPIAVVSTFVDITESRAANERLRASETRYRILAGHSADLITHRTRDNVVTYASPSHEVVLGWTPEEVVGQPPFSLVHPDDIERLQRLHAAEGSQRQHPAITVRVRHKAGHYVWLELMTSVQRDENDRVDGFVVTARDVSARKALEDELRRTKESDVSTPAVPAAAVPRAAATRAAVPAVRDPATPVPTVLLVDDDESVCRVVARQLHGSGFAVVTASCGADALAVLRNPESEVNAVVTDMRMPGMSGVELVSTMLSEGIHRPVVLVSGLMDQEVPQTWPAAAQVRFLQKPLSGVALRHAVTDLLAASARHLAS